MKLQLLFLQLQNKTFYLIRKAPGARLLLGESPGKSKRLQLLESSEPPGAYDYSVFIVFHKPNRRQTTSFKSFKSFKSLKLHKVILRPSAMTCLVLPQIHQGKPVFARPKPGNIFFSVSLVL